MTQANQYPTPLIKQGIAGERIVDNYMEKEWEGNNLDKKHYSVETGPDFKKGKFIGIEVKYWLSRHLDLLSFRNDVLPRLEEYHIKVLIFIYGGSRKGENYEDRIQEICKQHNVIPLILDIEKISFHKIKQLEHKLASICPRFFNGETVITQQEDCSFFQLLTLFGGQFSSISSMFSVIVSLCVLFVVDKCGVDPPPWLVLGWFCSGLTVSPNDEYLEGGFKSYDGFG